MKNIRINNPRKNYYTVVADTDEFGINEVVFEGISLEECIAYIKANTKAQKRPLWAVGVETERTHRRHYVVVRSRDASTAWSQVYRHGYNNGYLCVDRINISAESPAITPTAEQEQEAPAETAAEAPETAEETESEEQTTLATETTETAAPILLETLAAKLDRMTAAETVRAWAALTGPAYDGEAGTVDAATDGAIYKALQTIDPAAYWKWQNMPTPIDWAYSDSPERHTHMMEIEAEDVRNLFDAYGVTA